MLMEDMSRSKCFSKFQYHMFHVLHPFVTYLLTLPRIEEYKLSKNCEAVRNQRSERTILKKEVNAATGRRELN
jgi:hypothetical protein